MTAPLRITRFALEKYGPFSDRELTFRDDAALHIVYGHNEAGKSVTLRALTDLFCGFPATIKSDDYRILRFKSGELRLGATLRDAEGRNLLFRRRAGRANTLLGAQDNEKFDEAMFRMLAGAPERSHFETEFGLTAEKLRSGGESLLAAGGRLADTLAAGSTQLSALNKIRTTLQEEAETLYLSSGRSRKLNAALERYQSAGKTLRAAIVTGDAIKRAREAFDAAQASHAGIVERLGEIEKRHALLVRAQRTRGKLRERASRLEQLAEFSDLPAVSEAAFAEWLAAFSEHVEVAKSLEDQNQRLRLIDGKTAALMAAPDLLASAGDIISLIKRLGAADDLRAHLPRREEAARSGLERLQHAAQALGLAGADALIEHMPKEMALTRTREILREKAALEDAWQRVSTRLDTARARLRKLEQAGTQRSQDPSSLARLFDTFADIPALAKRLREQEADLAEQTEKITRETQRLLPAIALQDLLHLPLPDAGAIETALQKFTELGQTSQQIARDNESLSQRIAANERSQLALAREGEVASAEDMRRARRLRDETVDSLEREQELPVIERGAHFSALRRSISDADRQADILLGSADRAARQQQLADEFAQLKDEELALHERQSLNKSLQNDFDTGWRKLFSGYGFAPLAPGAMRDWRAKAAALIGRHDGLSSARSALVAAQVEFGEKTAALKAFAHQAGIQIAEADAAITLHAQLRDGLAAQQKAWADGRAHEANLVNAADEIAEAEKEIAGLDQARASTEAAWHIALETLSLPQDAGAAEAEDALRIWAGAINDLHQYRDDEHRVKTITKDIEVFEMLAAELAARLAPDITGGSPEHIVEALSERLEAARAAAHEHARLDAERSEILRAIDAQDHLQNATRNSLYAAAAALTCAPDDLQMALDRMSRRRGLEQEIATLNHDIALAGDGLQAADLEREQKGLDFDAIGAEIAALDAQKTIALADLGAAAVAADGAGKALAELEGGRDAARHAIEKDEAAAELLEIARDWLIRSGAAKLASIAVERHRQRNQDPVFERISGLFALVTGGSFSGTVIDYDDGDQPVLKGLRANGERVEIAGFSEGTRDQLYLALRLALLEQRKGEHLPFIGDDLLASFDDARSAHALDLLAAFGEQRQTILFTHHRHVVDIAQRQLGGRLDLVEIGG